MIKGSPYAAIGGGVVELAPMVGDALVDKGLTEKIRYAHSVPEIGRISLITNGILLRRPRFEALAEAELDYRHVGHTRASATSFSQSWSGRSYAAEMSAAMFVRSPRSKRRRFRSGHVPNICRKCRHDTPARETVHSRA